LRNIVSGLVKQSRGSVKFDGVEVAARTPQQRNIAQMFQLPVIYPRNRSCRECQTAESEHWRGLAADRWNCGAVPNG
jgi:ABC-type branched-subunit amino acid transport system ATPase component